MQLDVFTLVPHAFAWLTEQRPVATVLGTELDGGLEYPHYTRPPDFRGWRVPEILLSGDHGKIEEWRREQSRRRTVT